MTMGNIVLRVNASIQQEVTDLAAADTIWNRLFTLYGTSSPQGVYKDFKEALNIRLNGNQHPGPQIDKMAACFQRMTSCLCPYSPSAARHDLASCHAIQMGDANLHLPQ
jgi:hypothetical protein